MRFANHNAIMASELYFGTLSAGASLKSAAEGNWRRVLIIPLFGNALREAGKYFKVEEANLIGTSILLGSMVVYPCILTTAAIRMLSSDTPRMRLMALIGGVTVNVTLLLRAFHQIKKQ